MRCASRKRRRLPDGDRPWKRFTPAWKARGSAGPILKRELPAVKIVLTGRVSNCMGQKTNPIGFRVAVNGIKDWRSKWYAGKKNSASCSLKTGKIRRFAEEETGDGFRPENSDRTRGQPLPYHHSHRLRPGVVIGIPQRRRNRQDQGRAEQDVTGKEIYVDIIEIKQPEIDAQLVAENVAPGIGTPRFV